MTRETIKRRLRGFLGQTFPGRALDDGDDIFALGFGNSLFATQLVEFVETEFAIEITDDDLDIENFKSIALIAQLVERKTTLAAAS